MLRTYLSSTSARGERQQTCVKEFTNVLLCFLLTVAMTVVFGIVSVGDRGGRDAADPEEIFKHLRGISFRLLDSVGACSSVVPLQLSLRTSVR